jgi:DNA invertase Pin-like site-specific DNA recombinase
VRQVISYLRVSADKQGKGGLGIEAQRESVARFIAADGCEALGEYVEVETGKGADALDRRPPACRRISRRPQGEGRRRCGEAGSAVPRRPFHLRPDGAAGAIRRGGIGRQGGPVQRHIYAALTEKERALISDRTRAALAQKKAQGVVLGNRTNLPDGSAKGADAFAANVLPVV